MLPCCVLFIFVLGENNFKLFVTSNSNFRLCLIKFLLLKSILNNLNLSHSHIHLMELSGSYRMFGGNGMIGNSMVIQQFVYNCRNQFQCFTKCYNRFPFCRWNLWLQNCVCRFYEHVLSFCAMYDLQIFMFDRHWLVYLMLF